MFKKLDQFLQLKYLVLTMQGNYAVQSMSSSCLSSYSYKEINYCFPTLYVSSAYVFSRLPHA